MDTLDISLIRERLEQVRQHVNMTEGEFADAIAVRRATIVNINKGRNNPSLDVVVRTVNRFDEINPVWLLQGEGNMLLAKSGEENDDLPLFANRENTKTATKVSAAFEKTNLMEPEVLSKVLKETMSEAMNVQRSIPPRKITEIRIFFDDNTYEIFAPHKMT